MTARTPSETAEPDGEGSEESANRRIARAGSADMPQHEDDRSGKRDPRDDVPNSVAEKRGDQPDPAEQSEDDRHGPDLTG